MRTVLPFYLYNLETGEWGELMFGSGQLEFRPDSMGIYILRQDNFDHIEGDEEEIRIVSIHGWEMENLHEPRLRAMTFRARPAGIRKVKGDIGKIRAVREYLASELAIL